MTAISSLDRFQAQSIWEMSAYRSDYQLGKERLNNPGDTIAATNWANLDFTYWIDANGGMGGGSLPASLTSRNAVVHLITDDIYLDLSFTGWTQQGGGGFSYMRAENPVPEPAAAILAFIGLVTLAGRRNWKR